MKCLYEICPDQTRWGRLNSIEAMHSWKIPGVSCPNCGVWAMTGINYPSFNISILKGLSLPLNHLPMHLEEYCSIVAAIQPILGVDKPIKPGVNLGPLRGKAKGKFGDFAWINPWTILIRESIWNSIKQAGIHLNGIFAQLDFKKQPHESLIEIEALPRVSLLRDLMLEKCSICGRVPVKTTENLRIDATSFDDCIPLQRIAELPTVLVVNETFAQYIHQRNLSDVVLKPIEVV